MLGSKQKQGYFANFVFFLKKAVLLMSGYRRFFIFGLILLFITESLQLLAQYWFSNIVDFLPQLAAGGVIDKLIWLVAAMVASFLIISVVEYFTVLLMTKTMIRFEHHLSLIVYGKLLDLSMAYHERENTGAKLTKLENGIDRFRDMLERLFWDFSPTIIRVVISAVVLFTIDYRIALVFIAVVPLYLLLTIRMNNKVNPIRKQIREGYESVYGKFTQAVFNVKTVQLFAQEAEEKRRAKTGIAGIIRSQFRWAHINFKANFWRSNVNNLGIILILSFGVYLAVRGQITIGELVLFLTLSFDSYDGLYNMSRVIDHLLDAKVSVERMLKILENDEVVKSAPNAVKLNLKGKIEFRDVSFAYKDKNVLDDIELTVEPGEVVALVGPSGGGKSTIAKLLYRYYDVSHGGLFIDGVDIKKLNLRHFREQLGMVSQDIDMFDDTIKENIAYGKPGASIRAIKAAAMAANADEFIEKIPEKYEAMVGERGVKLSGGQRQRIGIARALLVNPKILVLDEATSSLDSESERKIQQAIRRLIKGRTTIIIAHRLSTIRNADKIVVIDQGRIAEAGKHDELMAKGGIYSRLVNLQVSGYLRE